MNESVVIIRGGERQLYPIEPNQSYVPVQKALTEPDGSILEAGIRTRTENIQIHQIHELKQAYPNGPIRTKTTHVAIHPDTPTELQDLVRLLNNRAVRAERAEIEVRDLYHHTKADLVDATRRISRFQGASLFHRIWMAIEGSLA